MATKFGHKKLYIDGQLVESESSKSFDIICPGDETIIASIAWASKQDALRALTAAQEGFKRWSQTDVAERVSWMHKLRDKVIEHRDHLRESIMYEMGKVWAGTDEDLTSLSDSLAYYADEVQKVSDIPIPDKEGSHEHRLVHQPLGVVVAFLAYNFPLLNLGFKLSPALAAGCSIIIKPSEYSALSAYIIAELCAEINFPKGVINILCGDVQEVAIPLSESRIPRMITMIGSTETAQKLIAQSSRTSIKQYSMECGGNAPFIVFEDADLDLALDLAVALKIGNSGQICVAPNRFYIHESLVETFKDQMKERFAQVKTGFGRENNPDMGPLANQASVLKTHDIVNRAIDQGGELSFGGNPMASTGYYFEPTIIHLPNNQADILQEEIFGPVAMITSFKTKEEAMELANSTNAGLASYAFSTDQETLDYCSIHLEFGEIQLNGVKYDIYLPHGGIKNSGIGVDCSAYALEDYMIRKRISTAIAT